MFCNSRLTVIAGRLSNPSIPPMSQTITKLLRSLWVSENKRNFVKAKYLLYPIFSTDLQTVENRVASGHYGKLAEFVGDVMRIFENCRYFNQPNTQIMKCAEGLETFFAQKLGLLREKLETTERVND